MSKTHNHIFNRKLLNAKLENVNLGQYKDYQEVKKIILDWKYSIENSDLEKTKEKSIQGDFLTNFFSDILGYKKRYGNKVWNITQEQKTELDATTSDGALGFFTSDVQDIRVVVELKDAKTKLDRKQSGRDNKITPVDQGFLYANKFKGCNWVIISNFKEIRLYNSSSEMEYEEFIITELTDDYNLKRFLYLLSKDNLISRDSKSLVDLLFEKNEKEQKNISELFYRDYRNVRLELFEGIKKYNSRVDELIILEKTQKLLDRFIFVCFCEDKGLLPHNTFKNVLKIGKMSYDKSENQIWIQLKGLFYAINVGNDDLKINKYNGGLFKEDKELDSMLIPDKLFDNLEMISSYDFDTDLNINILGHIFENSINDIEELKSAIKGEKIEKKLGKRNKEGIYYTPEYITKYIVEVTIGEWLKDRKTELNEDSLPNIPDKQSCKTSSQKSKRKKAIIKHLRFWEEYRIILKNIRILDSSCGSGAFLNQAFNYLYNEGISVNTIISELQEVEGQTTFFDLNEQILRNNLYGVDINEESVEITKLSLWLRTASENEPLTSLDDNIKCGNSIINDNDYSEKAFNWVIEFDEVFKNGGFDIIIGNPPYGASLSSNEKKYLDKEYTLVQYNHDSYKYFMELSYKIAKNNGYIGLITPNTYLVSENDVKLREHTFNNYQIINLVEVFNVFPDAIVEPMITILKKNKTYEDYNFEVLLSERNHKSKENIFYDSRIQVFNKKDLLKRKGLIFNYHENTDDKELLSKIHSITYRLSDIAVVTTGIKPYQKGKGKPPQTPEILKEKPYTSYNKDNSTWIPLLRGTQINRYLIKWEGEFINYGIWLAEPRTPEIFFEPKLLIRRTDDKLLVAYDENGFIAINSAHCIQLKSDYKNISLKYLLALINSKLINWVFAIENFHMIGKPLAEVKVKYVERLPIAIPKKEVEEVIIKIVDDLIDLKKVSHVKTNQFLEYLRNMYSITKMRSKLYDFSELEFIRFIEELKKSKAKLNENDKFELFNLFEKKKSEIRELKEKILILEQQIDNLVFEVYEMEETDIYIIENYDKDTN